MALQWYGRRNDLDDSLDASSSQFRKSPMTLPAPSQPFIPQVSSGNPDVVSDNIKPGRQRTGASTADQSASRTEMFGSMYDPMSTGSTLATITRTHPIWSGGSSSSSSYLSSRIPSDHAILPSSTTMGGQWGPPGRHGPDGDDDGAIYAIAAIVPIAVLAIVAVVVFFCLRKRNRRQRNIAAAQVKAQEMRARQPTTIQPYLAPPPLTAPHYPAHLGSVSSLPLSGPPQPVILGPILSGSNGAYFTGIDTSDLVSVTSGTDRGAPPDPFADSNSLNEPPPPYRPRSAAPPSFTGFSRNSSVREAAAPAATSQTNLIERSPFEDGDGVDDEDGISEMSGPTVEQHADNMSAVSDLSYQQDPVIDGRFTV